MLSTPLPKGLLHVAVVTVLALTPLLSFSQQYVFKTQISLQPVPGYDVKGEIDKFLQKISSNDPMSESELEANRKDLAPQFERRRYGFTCDGETRISCGPWGRFVKTIQPDLSTGKATEVAYLFKDGQTYSAPLLETATGQITNYDSGNALSSQTDLVIFARKKLEGKLTRSKPTEKGTDDVYSYKDSLGRSLEAQVLRDNQRIKSIISSGLTASGMTPLAKYTVLDYTQDGQPSSVKVERFANGRLHQIETYTLTSILPSEAPMPEDVLRPGMKVVDTRLGTEPSVSLSYQIVKNVPLRNQLANLAHANLQPTSTVNQNKFKPDRLAFGGGIALVAIGLALMIRRKNH